MSGLTIIVAVTSKNGIGRKARLPWRLQKEMKYFAQVTSRAPEGHRNAVVMGRNTWESIPSKFRPLPNRLNIIITTNQNYDLGTPDNTSAVVKNDLHAGLMHDGTETMPIYRRFVIGGASLYSDTLALPSMRNAPYVDRVLLTRIVSPDFDECDVFMPDFTGVGSGNGSRWKRTSHAALQEWVGFEVPKGMQEENGVNYEFQMWIRDE